MGKPRGVPKGSPRVGGRQVGTPNKKSLEAVEMLARLDCNPLEGMAKIASGDVLALGYMTPKELKEPPTYDRNGRVIRMSGVERALSYVPPMLRAQMYKELAQYVHPKRSQVAHTGADGKNLQMGQAAVVVQLPPNGR